MTLMNDKPRICNINPVFVHTKTGLVVTKTDIGWTKTELV